MYIDDEPDAIRRKLKRAQTDSGSEVVRGAGQGRGSTNLIEILAVDARRSTPEEVESEFDGPGLRGLQGGRRRGRGGLLAPVRERYRELRADEAGARGRRSSRGRRAGARDRRAE